MTEASSLVQPAVAGLTVVLLLLAAGADLATRRIPNALCAAIALLGLLASLSAGLIAAASALGMAALLFAGLSLLWRRGLLGGGDLKLLTALALGLAPLDCLRCLEFTALAGGALALAYLAGAHLLPAWKPRGRNTALRLAARELWRIRHRAGLPYGIAIAAGGTLVLLPQ